MKAEIIAVGTELLLGQITNTNAQYLSRELANLGIDVYFQTVVGDNQTRLMQAFQLAEERADLVICTGGLGPTQDDLTKDVLAAFVSKSLIIHQPSLDKIESYFIDRGISMVKSNARQALITEDSIALFNDVGMASGLVLKHNETFFILLPGPPREMKVMFENYTKDWLKSELKEVIQLYSKTLKFAGIGESSLENELLDLINTQQDPTIAPYAKEGEVAIRLSTKAQSLTEAEAKIKATQDAIYKRLEQYIYAEEDISLEQAVVRLLTEKKLSLSAAESCTGGMLSNMITSIPGSSGVYRGGIICYSNAIKEQLLQVPLEMLEGHDAPGAVSSETANILAKNLLDITHSDYAISITGVAGPESVENKPVGLVYMGIVQKGKAVHVEKVQYTGNREMVRLKACKHALYKLWQLIEETK
jgi:nicotinamide-nucleotide amidase